MDLSAPPIKVCSKPSAPLRCSHWGDKCCPPWGVAELHKPYFCTISLNVQILFKGHLGTPRAAAGTTQWDRRPIPKTGSLAYSDTSMPCSSGACCSVSTHGPGQHSVLDRLWCLLRTKDCLELFFCFVLMPIPMPHCISLWEMPIAPRNADMWKHNKLFPFLHNSSNGGEGAQIPKSLPLH